MLISVEVDEQALPSEKMEALASMLDARVKDSVLNAIIDVTGISWDDADKALTNIHIAYLG